MMQIVNTTPMVLKCQIEEAIAKAVADQNKWKIWAESDKTGTKFSVSF